MGRAAARRLGVALGAGALVAVGLAATTVPATADTDTTIAYWQMNESGGDVMHDSSGNGIDGTIGDRVTVGQGYYSFAYVPPGAATAYAALRPCVIDTAAAPPRTIGRVPSYESSAPVSPRPTSARRAASRPQA